MTIADVGQMPNVGNEPPGSSVTDARPILERSVANVWERVAERRSKLREAVEQECRKSNIEALVLESHPYVHPAWVKFECWMPVTDRTLTRRSSMTATIASVPYHEFDAVCKVEWTVQGSSGAVDQIHSFGPREIEQIIPLLVAERGRSKQIARLLRKRQLRQNSLEFWRPKNKITVFRTDWLKTAATFLIVVGGFGFFGSAVRTPGVALASLVALAIGVLLWLRIRRGGHLVRSVGKPFGEPRDLRYLDSWQTVVFGGGGDSDEVRRRIISRFTGTRQQHFAHTTERIWYWGLEGKEEREQIVLRYGRALVFAHVYRYGDDLYVGWAAQLNVGQWVEKTLAKGVERSTGKRVELKSVENGSQQASEYDLIDLNCLAEWTHAQITQVLKQYMSGRAIDQEIDFTIIRGERKNVRDAEKKQEKTSRFRRTA